MNVSDSIIGTLIANSERYRAVGTACVQDICQVVGVFGEKEPLIATAELAFNNPLVLRYKGYRFIWIAEEEKAFVIDSDNNVFLSGHFHRGDWRVLSFLPGHWQDYLDLHLAELRYLGSQGSYPELQLDDGDLIVHAYDKEVRMTAHQILLIHELYN